MKGRQQGNSLYFFTNYKGRSGSLAIGDWNERAATMGRNDRVTTMGSRQSSKYGHERYL